MHMLLLHGKYFKKTAQKRCYKINTTVLSIRIAKRTKKRNVEIEIKLNRTHSTDNRH